MALKLINNLYKYQNKQIIIDLILNGVEYKVIILENRINKYKNEEYCIKIINK